MWKRKLISNTISMLRTNVLYHCLCMLLHYKKKHTINESISNLTTKPTITNNKKSNFYDYKFFSYYDFLLKQKNEKMLFMNSIQCFSK